MSSTEHDDELTVELPVPGSTGTLTPKQAADACRVSVRTVRRWLAAEQLPGAYRTPDDCWHIPLAALTGRLPTGADATPERAPATTTTSSVTEHELRLELAVERARREAAELLADERGRRADKLEAALESTLATLRAQTLQLGPGATPGSLEPTMSAPSPTPTPPAPAPRARWWSRQ